MKQVRVLLVFLILPVLLAACTPPGEGPKAEAGYAASEPVIAALEAYQADHGHYPETLTELVGDYLDEEPEEVNDYPLEYEALEDGQSYRLTFRYTGPGMNECHISPGSDWSCSGYY